MRKANISIIHLLVEQILIVCLSLGYTCKYSTWKYKETNCISEFTSWGFPTATREKIIRICTAGFKKLVPLLTNTIYLSRSTKVAEGTVFRKQTVDNIHTDPERNCPIKFFRIIENTIHFYCYTFLYVPFYTIIKYLYLLISRLLESASLMGG